MELPNCLGSCCGNSPEPSQRLAIKTTRDTSNGAKGKDAWESNVYAYRDFRFAMTFENTLKKGYVTEKILGAFTSGSIPVYYGSDEIFTIFNRKAFVFFDIKAPEAGIERLFHLAANKSAYEAALAEPVLAGDSKETYERFFGGRMRRRVRALLGASEGPT